MSDQAETPADQAPDQAPGPGNVAVPEGAVAQPADPPSDPANPSDPSNPSNPAATSLSSELPDPSIMEGSDAGAPPPPPDPAVQPMPAPEPDPIPAPLPPTPEDQVALNEGLPPTPVSPSSFPEDTRTSDSAPSTPGQEQPPTAPPVSLVPGHDTADRTTDPTAIVQQPDDPFIIVVAAESPSLEDLIAALDQEVASLKLSAWNADTFRLDYLVAQFKALVGTPPPGE